VVVGAWRNEGLRLGTRMDLPAGISASLARLGLVPGGAAPVAERLSGGVSSDIWRVEAGDQTFCVKRAMPKLAVKDDWFVPVERNRYERLWYEVAGARVAGIAPEVLGFDDDAGFFVMAWLDPAAHRLWKAGLMAGQVDPAFAAAVGSRLAAIHSTTAGDVKVQELFPTGALFEALRLDPYLRATGRRHPDLAEALNALADRTAATQVALVHGDVSPKNIMIGPDGPVFLDAECAWYGDPAFDLAFCLNHLLLKCLARPDAKASLLVAFDELRDAYLCDVDWEPVAELETRATSLLPGLLLARVDGKSPVEYLTEESDRERVRRAARPLIANPPATLAAVRDAFAGHLS
jgi:aminoglycoside phosphotransferase (APT) family kinase protein